MDATQPPAPSTETVAPSANADAPVKAPRKPAGKKSAVSDVGTTFLPAARVTKIIKADKDIAMCSKEAVFLISVAAEHFVKKLTDAAYVNSRMEKRKGIQYKDLATAIQRNQSFFYLSEVIPVPTTAKEALKQRKRKIADDNGEVEEAEEASSNPVVQQPNPSTSTIEPTPSSSVAPPTAQQKTASPSRASLSDLLNADTPSMPPPSTISSVQPTQSQPEQDVTMETS